MPLKLEKRCKVCQACKENPALIKRIFASKFYMKGGEALRYICRDTNLPYESMLKHTKLHQTLSADAMAEAKARQVANISSQQMLTKAVRVVDARAEFIAEGYKKFKSGEWDEQMTLKDWLRGMADADTREMKVKDQGIDFMKMMAAMRSGDQAGEQPVLDVPDPEDVPLFDPWETDDRL